MATTFFDPRRDFHIAGALLEQLKLVGCDVPPFLKNCALSTTHVENNINDPMRAQEPEASPPVGSDNVEKYVVGAMETGKVQKFVSAFTSKQ